MRRRNLTRLSIVGLLACAQLAPVARAAEDTGVPAPVAARTPEDLIVALGRCAKPDWASKYRPPLAASPSSRAQIALLVGSLFADGYLAAQAEDAQQCRNVGKDIMALAKTLGVQAELLDRSRSLADSAQRRDWPLLRRELEATESDLCAALRKHEDAGLAHLVTLGAWMRGTEIVASLLKDSYTENAALLLRQPALNRVLDAGFQPLNEKLRSDAVLTVIQGRLSTVAQLLSGPGESILSREEVNTLAQTLGSIFQDITTRQN